MRLKGGCRSFLSNLNIFRCVLASLSEGLSVRRSVRPTVTSYFQNQKMMVFLCVFYQGSLGTSQNCISVGKYACWSIHLSMLKVEKMVERTHLLVEQTCLMGDTHFFSLNGYFDLVSKNPKEIR